MKTITIAPDFIEHMKERKSPFITHWLSTFGEKKKGHRIIRLNERCVLSISSFADLGANVSDDTAGQDQICKIK